MSTSFDALFRRVSILRSTRVVLTVSAVAAILASRRCPRLAIAIVVIALARPLTEWTLKKLVSRDRPIGDRMVRGKGYSFSERTFAGDGGESLDPSPTAASPCASGDPFSGYPFVKP